MESDKINLILQIVLPSIGGLWILYLYFKEGLHRPRIEFDISCNVIGKMHDNQIVEFQITANNKGRIKFTFWEIKLRVRGIADLKSIKYLKKTHRLKFPKLILEENIIPENYGYYFAESGTKQTFTYTTTVSSEIKYILAFASFKYKRRLKIKLCPIRIIKEQHTCERTFKLV